MIRFKKTLKNFFLPFQCRINIDPRLMLLSLRQDLDNTSLSLKILCILIETSTNLRNLGIKVVKKNQ